MPAARPVFPGTFYEITRRCVQGQFLMRPDDATNENFLYCLGVAAKLYGIVLMLSQMMSNHHHTYVYDPHGRIHEFTEYFHKLFAKSQNVLRGRKESFFNSAPVCNVELIGIEKILDKMVYGATNPVKDGLVDRVHHWPGPNTVAALIHGKTLIAKRPKFFFSKRRKKMPESVELKFEFPAELGDPRRLRAEFAARLARAEKAIIAKRCGRAVLGRRLILQQNWRGAPEDGIGHTMKVGGIRPRVASRSAADRIDALRRYKEFVVAYRKARAQWLAGVPTVFPPGTYWLKRFANVTVAV